MKQSSGSALVCALRVEHAVTGETLGPIEVEVLEPRWFGWSLTYRRDHALFVVDEDLLDEQPERTEVEVRLTDPLTRSLVRPLDAEPESQPSDPPCRELGECGLVHAARAPEGEGAARDSRPAEGPAIGRWTIERGGTGDGTQRVVRVAPAAATLEVVLVDQLGRPSSGAAVEIRGVEDAPSVPLTEVTWDCANSAVPGAGVYRSCPPRVWDARYHPFQVVVDGERVADRFMNYSTLVTRHRLVTSRTLREMD